jgi:CubicO group peptidase (beta-lactamase class C family)
LSRTAPTTHDDESKNDPGKNPDFDSLLRGVVFDPTARRMGGVAGHAGVFSTAHDVSLYAQALLDRLAGRPSKFPLTQATLELMTTPEQPGHSAQQVEAANNAAQEAIAKAPNTYDPLLAPHYPAIRGQNLRGFGWDIDTAYSGTRGMIFPIGSFGHTGFTGTSLWMDPGSDTYVILFTSAIDPRDDPPIAYLRGDVATAAARALR